MSQSHTVVWGAWRLRRGASWRDGQAGWCTEEPGVAVHHSSSASFVLYDARLCPVFTIKFKCMFSWKPLDLLISNFMSGSLIFLLLNLCYNDQLCHSIHLSKLFENSFTLSDSFLPKGRVVVQTCARHSWRYFHFWPTQQSHWIIMCFIWWWGAWSSAELNSFLQEDTEVGV